MRTTFVEYDEAGVIFHVCVVETAEGYVPAPAATATAAERDAHTQAVQAAITAKAAATRTALQAQRTAGKRLLVLPDGADTPSADAYRVDHANGRLIPAPGH